jgi:hypothetical protein
MNRERKFLTAALAIFSTMLLFTYALAGESASYRSYPQVMDNGGGKSISAGYQARASIGQPVVGPSESATGTFYAGFLYTAYAHPAPSTNKNIAISRLEQLKPFMSEPDQRKVEEAIEDIEESLDPNLWLGAWRLSHLKREKEYMDGLIETDGGVKGSVIVEIEQDDDLYLGEKRHGDQVFKREKEAAKKVKVLTHKKVHTEMLAELVATAVNIMAADSTLAQVKIMEAELSGGDPAELQKARDAMFKAEREKQKKNPEYGEVVDFYGKAWHHAVRAEEKGGGGLGPGNVQVATLEATGPVYAMGKPYPNPSRAGSVLRFGVAEDCDVSLRVYDATGRLVRTLVDESRAAGYYACEWDTKDERGQAVASGTYIYRLIAGPFASARMVVVVR